MKAAAPSSFDIDVSSLPPALVRVLESRTFERASALRVLLAYLWQHRDEPLSEYAIATEALGRSPLFDAKIDATVRVQISRLRQRLEKYYEEEGASAAERIVIPLGSHQIRTEATAVLVDEPTQQIAGEALTTPQRPRAAVFLAWACAALVLACIALSVALLSRRPIANTAFSVQEAPPFWRNFFGSARPTRIILPTPIFFSFTRQPGDRWGAIMLRDTEINDYAKRQQSPQYRAFESTLGPSELAANYTVTSDTFASVRLARYLDRSGLATTVLSSADAPLEALDTENVIALGTWGTLSPLQPYLERMNYVLGRHEITVEVRNPAPGDPERVDFISESAERSVWPGVIGYLPGRGGHSHLLVLASRHTSALVEFLTSSNGLDQLDRLWKAKGSPEYYEMIVNAEMDGQKLVRFWPVALRRFHP